MSRRLYRQMANARAALNNRSGDTFDYLGYKAQQDAEKASVPAVKEWTAPTRVHHPAIKTPEHKCYRVIRHYMQHGETHWEDIGAFQHVAPALMLSNREVSWAIVLHPNGKRIAYNWQPMETRS